MKGQPFDIHNATRVLNKETINDLPYLTAVLKEALRIDSTATASLSYYAKEDIEICGVKIPKGMELVQGSVALNNDPSVWSDPRVFKPERFLTDSKEFLTPEGKKRHPLQFNTFGSGMRNCAGQTLAMAEMKFLTILILMTTDIELTEEFKNKKDCAFSISSEMKLKGSLSRNDYWDK